MNKGSKRIRKPTETTLGTAKKVLPCAPAVDDVSQLRKPINTCLNGVNEILKVLKDATFEVKNCVINECDVIYECKICQSLFRSLANFILHKRKYCTNISRQYSTIYQEIVTSSSNDQNSSDTNQVLGFQKRITSLDKIVNNLHQNEQIKQEIKQIIEKDLSNDPESKSVKNMDDHEKNTAEFNKIVLEKINNNNTAVFQTLANNQEDCPLIKSQIMEIHKHLEQDIPLLNSNGKIEKYATSNPTLNQFKCSECKHKFPSKNNLIHHVKLHHNESKIVYPCPICKMSYASPWSVYRHLSKVHKLENKQIKRFRDQINSGSIRRKDCISKYEQEAAAIVKPEGISIEYQWINHIEGDKDFQMCAGCGKHFERKAALNSHSQMCVKRLEMCNNIEQNEKKRREEANSVPLVQPPTGASKRKQKMTIKYNKVQPKNVVDTNSPAEVSEQPQSSDIQVIPEEICVQNKEENVPDKITVINNENVEKSDKIQENLDNNSTNDVISISSISSSGTDNEMSASLEKSLKTPPSVTASDTTHNTSETTHNSSKLPIAAVDTNKLLPNASVSSDLPTFEQFYQKVCKQSKMHVEKDKVPQCPLKKRRVDSRVSKSNQKKKKLVNELKGQQQDKIDVDAFNDLQQMSPPLELTMPPDVSYYIKSFNGPEEADCNDSSQKPATVAPTASNLPPIVCDDSNDEWMIPTNTNKPIDTQMKKCKQNIDLTSVTVRPCRNRSKRKQNADFLYYDDEKNVNIFNGR